MKRKIGIIGLGYVGLPLAVEFGRIYETIGFDINTKRIDDLIDGIDITNQVDLSSTKDDINLWFTSNPQCLSSCDIFIITVPTPIDKFENPDLSCLNVATEIVGKHLAKGNLVIYESTVYPGVTDDISIPLLEKISGLKVNEEFDCGYSPERVNPGLNSRKLIDIVKITSGSNEEAAYKVDQLYAEILNVRTYPVKSIKVAEAAKVLENTQRDVNIALINEVSMIFDKIGISTKEVLDAASSKWNFHKYVPGFVGGHCIGVDPYYLTYKAQEMGYVPNLILASRQVNKGMSSYVSAKIIEALVQKDVPIQGSKILILGLSYKENCNDTRNSLVFDLIEQLSAFKCRVDVYDPWVDTENISSVNFISNLERVDNHYDCVVLAVAHDLLKMISQSKLNSLTNEKNILIDLKGCLEESTWTLN